MCYEDFITAVAIGCNKHITYNWSNTSQEVMNLWWWFLQQTAVTWSNHMIAIEQKPTRTLLLCSVINHQYSLRQVYCFKESWWHPDDNLHVYPSRLSRFTDELLNSYKIGPWCHVPGPDARNSIKQATGSITDVLLELPQYFQLPCCPKNI